jgi:hypothetical protein
VSVGLVAVLGVAGLLAMIFARVPIAIALAASGLLGYAALDGWGPALKMFGRVPFTLASAYSLSVIPLFILMGAVAARGNMAKELFDAANGLFAGVRSRTRPSAPARCSARSAARRSPPPRPSPRSRSRRCAGTATTRHSPPARWRAPARSTC